MKTPIRAGATVGHILITGEVGAGGMGEVYLGFDETLRRTVAVKTISRDARLSPVARARFLREARALSQLDHPNICKIHDYVEGEDGDVLVLEHIEGRNLEDAIRSGLDRALKLKIAEQIADALLAAHEKGIVHRDIKPNNVMLTAADDVKVLDFGLARLARGGAHSSAGPIARPQVDSEQLDAPTLGLSEAEAFEDSELVPGAPNEESVYTVHGGVVGTPRYMSPEQARGEPVTAASDMYSFGLLLRELFTGRPAEDTRTPPLGSTLTEEMRRLRPIPGLPGELRSLVERLESPAPGARPTAAETLSRLRWIRAAPKRRNRRILVAGLALVAVLAGLKYTLDLRQERSQAMAARDQAEQLADFLIGLFEVSDPGEARGRTITAREILSHGADRVAAELGDQPLAQAKLMQTIGVVSTNLGLYDEARPLLERSLEIREAATGAASLEVADSLHSLAVLDDRQGLYSEGEALARRSLAIREAELGPENLEVAESLHGLGVLQERQAEFGQAETALKRAVALREAVLGPNHPEVAESLRELGIVHQGQGRYADAEGCYRRALAIFEGAFGDDHPDVGASLTSLASVTYLQGDFEEAGDLYRRALAIREETLGPDHPDVALALTSIAAILQIEGRLDEAEVALRRALAIQEASLGPRHPEVADSLSRLATLCLYQGRPAEAGPLYRRAVAVLEDGGLGESPQMVRALSELASYLDDSGAHEESARTIRRAYDLGQQILEPDDPMHADLCFGLAYVCFHRLDRPGEAAPLYARAIAIWEGIMAPGEPVLVVARTDYARLLRGAGRSEEAAAVEAAIPPDLREGATSSPR